MMTWFWEVNKLIFIVILLVVSCYTWKETRKRHKYKWLCLLSKYTLTGHFIRSILLILGWTAFCLNSSYTTVYSAGKILVHINMIVSQLLVVLPYDYSVLIVMLKKLTRFELCVWLEGAIRSWVHCSHKGSPCQNNAAGHFLGTYFALYKYPFIQCSFLI